jgi:hypothetical protein
MSIKRLRIIVRKMPSGLRVAQSPDMPGLHVAERSHAGLLEELPKVVTALLSRRHLAATIKGQQIPDNESEEGWIDVAIPNSS